MHGCAGCGRHVLHRLDEARCASPNPGQDTSSGRLRLLDAQAARFWPPLVGEPHGSFALRAVTAASAIAWPRVSDTGSESVGGAAAALPLAGFDRLANAGASRRPVACSRSPCALPAHTRDSKGGRGRAGSPRDESEGLARCRRRRAPAPRGYARVPRLSVDQGGTLLGPTFRTDRVGAARAWVLCARTDAGAGVEVVTMAGGARNSQRRTFCRKAAWRRRVVRFSRPALTLSGKVYLL